MFRFIQLSCDFFMSRGFSDLPQVTVNGVVLELEDEVRERMKTERERIHTYKEGHTYTISY